jgi:hypothetical protein
LIKNNLNFQLLRGHPGHIVVLAGLLGNYQLQDVRVVLSGDGKQVRFVCGREKKVVGGGALEESSDSD